MIKACDSEYKHARYQAYIGDGQHQPFINCGYNRLTIGGILL